MTQGARVAVPVIAGNWKMHHGPSGTDAFFQAFLRAHAPDPNRTLLFFPPAVSLAAARTALGGRADIALGVQNVHWEARGAFTGETSVAMAVDAGATWALVGHSERRHVFGESDEETRLKVRAALEGGLGAVLCVGETLEERRAGRVEEVILRQLDAVLESLREGEAARLLVAYEPVWAIGTGETATPADASAAHAALRARLAERLGADAAGAVPILYGGSVKPDNAAELLGADEVDGVLVGGASLDPEGFAAIVEAEPAP